MLQVKVNKSYRDNDQLVVEASIMDGKEVLLDRKFAYPLDVKAELVKEEMVKFLSTYKSDIATGKEAEELEAKNAKADETIASLESLQVTDAKE